MIGGGVPLQHDDDELRVAAAARRVVGSELGDRVSVGVHRGTRMLLQRSVPPVALAATFGVLELIVGLSQITGTFAAQALIALISPEAALIGLGSFLAVLIVAVRRRVHAADEVSDVPVVVMSLLRRIPEFAPLPATEREAVARGAGEMPVADGAVVVVREGGRDDCVFAIAAAEFDVTIGGEHVRTLG